MASRLLPPTPGSRGQPRTVAPHPVLFSRVVRTRMRGIPYMKGPFMRRLAFLGSLLITTALGSFGCSNGNMDQAAFTASLTGANVVPPVTSASSGNTTLSFDGNSTVTYRVTLNAISGVTQVHIHSGATGATGPVRVTLWS